MFDWGDIVAALQHKWQSRLGVHVLLALACGWVLSACVTTPTPIATATVSEPTAAAVATPVRLPTATPAPSATPAAAPTATNAPTTLLVWLPANLPAAEQDYLQTSFSRFQADFPAIRLDLQTYDTPQTLVEAVAAGRVQFDLALGNALLLAPLQAEDVLQPLDELLPPDELNDFVGSALTGARRNGRLWGLPDSAGFHMLLYYNQALLPAPPTTLSELESLAAEQPPQTGLTFNSADPLWLLPWLNGFGGWPVDERGAIRLNTPEMVAALTRYRGWHSEAWFAGRPYDAALSAFREGDAAMLIDGAWTLAALDDMDAPWRVALLPEVDGRRAGSLVLGRYWAVGRESQGPRAEASLQLLAFITDPEQQLLRLEGTGLLPVRRAALVDPRVTSDARLRLSSQQLQAGQGLPLGLDPNLLLNAMREPLAALLTDELSPAEAAAAMQRNAEAALR